MFHFEYSRFYPVLTLMNIRFGMEHFSPRQWKKKQKKQNKEDLSQDELRNITEDLNQLKLEFQEIKSLKELLEQ